LLGYVQEPFGLICTKKENKMISFFIYLLIISTVVSYACYYLNSKNKLLYKPEIKLPIITQCNKEEHEDKIIFEIYFSGGKKGKSNSGDFNKGSHSFVNDYAKAMGWRR